MNATPRRERLPNRRLGETFELEVAGLRYTCTIGRFPDGRLAEIFLQNHKKTTLRPIPRRATARSCARSRSNVAPISKRSAKRFVGTAMAARAAFSAPRSITLLAIAHDQDRIAARTPANAAR
jgi:hypothetical protein